MKWNNIGKEFSKYSDIGNRGIYIFGAGIVGLRTLKMLEGITIKGFIDNSKSKQGQIIEGVKVFALEEITPSAEDIFVIAMDEFSYPEVFVQTREFVNNNNLSEDAVLHYMMFLSVYFYFTQGKIYVNQLNVSVTQKCTLNCLNCSIMTPYLNKKEDYDLECLKNDLDKMFSVVDYVGVLGVVGGEPFLYPRLEEYFSYIDENYKDRVLGKINIVSNGTVIPSESLLTLLKKMDVEVSVSNYSKSLPSIKDKVEKMVNVLSEDGLRYQVVEVDQWIDFGYMTADNSGLTEEELGRFFDRCRMPCKLLRNGKIYQCGNAEFAVDAGILDAEDPDNELELTKIDKANREMIIEFDNGFNKKGYVTLCKQCNGYLGMNHHYVDVALQYRKEDEADYGD